MSGRYFNYAHLTATAATTQVPNTGLPAAGNDAGMTLHVVAVNLVAATSVLTLFDAGSAGQCTAGNTIAVITAAQLVSLIYDVHVHNGLFYTLATAVGDYTISWA